MNKAEALQRQKKIAQDELKGIIELKGLLKLVKDHPGWEYFKRRFFDPAVKIQNANLHTESDPCVIHRAQGAINLVNALAVELEKLDKTEERFTKDISRLEGRA